jgi:hypothetical protein|eukprot:740072-Prymnesium_polylepis.1
MTLRSSPCRSLLCKTRGLVALSCAVNAALLPSKEDLLVDLSINENDTAICDSFADIGFDLYDFDNYHKFFSDESIISLPPAGVYEGAQGICDLGPLKPARPRCVIRRLARPFAFAVAGRRVCHVPGSIRTFP